MPAALGISPEAAGAVPAYVVSQHSPSGNFADISEERGGAELPVHLCFHCTTAQRKVPLAPKRLLPSTGAQLKRSHWSAFRLIRKLSNSCKCLQGKDSWVCWNADRASR